MLRILLILAVLSSLQWDIEAFRVMSLVRHSTPAQHNVANVNLDGLMRGVGQSQYRSRGRGDEPHSSMALQAKKKKLVSDDLLASLSEENSDDGAETATVTALEEKSSKKKLKKGTKLVSDDLLAAIDWDEDSEDSTKQAAAVKQAGDVVDSDKKKKKKKKDKTQGGDSDIDRSTIGEDGLRSSAVLSKSNKEIDTRADSDSDDSEVDEAAAAETAAALELTLEQKARKDKPSARVRFTDSAQPGVVSMGMEGVGLVYGDKVILSDTSFSVTNGERVGLVGPNGGGKSTSLKILAGEIEPTYGEVIKSSKNLRIAFLRQEFVEGLVMENTLKQELLESFYEEAKLLADIAACEKELEATTSDPVKMEEVLERLSKLQDKATARGAYSLEPRVDKVMDQIGFSKDDASALVSSFSGGWKMRIGLAKILLSDPNILFLDEPTNHMDLDSVIWLEGFLSAQNLPMVVVSHDREFLDRVCNKIVEVEEGKMVSYKGNYSNFLAQRRERLLQWKDKYDKQQRFIKEEEKWIKKHQNDENMAQQVRSKEQALEKLLKSEELIESPPRDRKFRFRFPDPPRCGELVVEGVNMMHGYGEGKYKTLFRDVDFKVERGHRIGFIGPNGSGKSTMMRLIYGIEEPKSGFADFGSSSVVASYYAQNQADALDLELTVLETLQDAADSDVSLTDMRTLLGQFMFKGDDVYKKIGVLSGGEKARVALCKLMLTPANLLLLDEPTNHLDITSKEVLEDALLHYPGSVLLISHDRYFMSQVVNSIFWFHDKTLERFDCDYHDYMVKMTEREGDTEAVRMLKEKVEARYVEGDKYQITNAKEVVLEEAGDKKNKKKNFGGSGVTSGNLFKGIKNAKRFAGGN